MTTIKLNIGGTYFETTRDTLSRSEYFNSLFDRWDTSTGNPYFIDRSGELFEHILGYLRNPEYPYPPEHYGELDFYGIKHNYKEYLSELEYVKASLELFKSELGKSEKRLKTCTNKLSDAELKINTYKCRLKETRKKSKRNNHCSDSDSDSCDAFRHYHK